MFHLLLVLAYAPLKRPDYLLNIALLEAKLYSAGLRLESAFTKEQRSAYNQSFLAKVEVFVVVTQLIRGLRNLPASFPGCAATIGNFDGVHLGHQTLLAEVKKQAQSRGLPAVVITFEPQPLEFFGKNPTLPRLMRWREKFLALAEYGIDIVMLLRFDDQLANLSAEDFVQDILQRGLKVAHMTIGDDFHFGKGRRGDFTLLKKMGEAGGFRVASIPTILVEHERVSSTRVRKALANDDHVLVKKLLGRPYTMRGRVVHGDKLGRQLGFPTANIFLHRKAAPVQGVYIVRLHGLTDKPLPGVANIGNRPTVNGTRELLEVHLFDFHQDIYGKAVCVEFCEKIRAEERYDTLQLLKAQIEEDAKTARNYFIARGELSA
jgi:riboflavin kinase/FMN adenylyltransferase